MLKSHLKKVLIAIGSNASADLKESNTLVANAIKSLSKEYITNINISKFYKTPAFPANSGPDFINCVLLGETYFSPHELLNKMHIIEEYFGRTRIKRWGQRTLDIDLLDFEEKVMPDNACVNEWMNMSLNEQKIKTPEQLILPHPRIQDRPFVLIPLGDVAPQWKHPILNKTSKEMLNELASELSIGISCFA